MNANETYTLMARCLKGEGSAQDNRQLTELLLSDPFLLKEYELLKASTDLTGSLDDKSIYTEEHLHTKFQRLTKRLKDDGAL